MTGALSSIVSFLVSLVVIIIFYRKFPATDLLALTPAFFVPLLGGLLSSIIPAERIVHMLNKPGAMKTKVGPNLWSKIMSAIIVLSSFLFLLITVSTAIHVIRGSVDRKEIVVQPIHADTTDITQTIKEEPTIQITNKNRAEYHLQLTMNEQKTFSVDAKITVSNLSSDDWDKLVFYMIPNVFTQNDDIKVFKADASFSIEKVLVNGIAANYSLVGDTLQVSLSRQLHPGVEANVQILYKFRVPQEGIRLTQVGEAFVLAQWYPMLATYQNSAWNKKPYDPKVESYFTDFSDFYVNYSLPGEYQIISSADTDPVAPVSSGSIEAKRIKEMTIIFSRNFSLVSEHIEGIEVRVWGDENNGVTKQLMKESLERAVNALGYFQTQIGGYPHKQIDIFLGGKLSMEYPGLVTVYPNGHWEHSLVHELAHQWFYGVVSNDPYIEGYLDEGMTELATSLYLNDFTFSEDYEKSRKEKYSNLPLSDYNAGETGVYLYSQPVLKMKSLFSKYNVDGMQFLKDYFEFFQYKQVTTQEFVNFTVDYFNMEDKTFFEQWLDLR